MLPEIDAVNPALRADADVVGRGPIVAPGHLSVLGLEVLRAPWADPDPISERVDELFARPEVDTPSVKGSIVRALTALLDAHKDTSGHQPAFLERGRAMTGNGMTEEELGRRHRALLVEIIEKATSEPAWKQKLMSDPQAAFDEAGLLPEIDALNPASLENVEVGGQMTSSSYVRTLLLCSFYKCSWPY